MKRIIALLMFVVVLMPVATHAQTPTFSTQLEDLLSTDLKDFNLIKGDYVTTLDNGSKEYKSELALTGFEPFIIVPTDGKAMFIALSSSPLSKLQMLLLIIVPPAGYTTRDSDSDSSITLQPGIKRMVTFISADKATILNMVFFDTDSYSLSITKS
jgi:hypothetical protein